jgi:putative flippase GtrA
MQGLVEKHRPRLIKLLKFLGAGLPAFVVAVPLNFWLVDRVGWPKPLAYFLVLFLQVSFNYLMCKVFVFRSEGRRASVGEYAKFTSGLLLFRAFDWGLYVILVEYVGVYYLLAQISNVVIFSIAKFFFAEKLLSKPRRVTEDRGADGEGRRECPGNERT